MIANMIVFWQPDTPLKVIFNGGRKRRMAQDRDISVFGNISAAAEAAFTAKEKELAARARALDADGHLTVTGRDLARIGQPQSGTVE